MFVRPDGRRFLRAPAAYLPGTDDLYVAVDEADDRARGAYERLGFEVSRRESVYRIETNPDVNGLRLVQPPPGVVFLSADGVDVDRLRLLDDALRQDVPGTDGWKWDAADFRAETFCTAFDAATYGVAVDAAVGDYVGLARVWKNPRRPRLGLVGVLAPYRRRGVARALLAHVFGVLHERGESEVEAEVDDLNTASSALMHGLGARRTGGVIEYVRRAEGRSAPTRS